MQESTIPAVLSITISKLSLNLSTAPVYVDSFKTRLRSARAWFLGIARLDVSMLCVRPLPKLLITSGVI